MRSFCKCAAITICAALAFLTVLLVLPGLFHIYPMIVQSGSMEPSYPEGSIIYVKKADADKFLEGDTVTFYLPDEETLVTHGIVRVDEEKKELHTQGDANAREDGIVTPFERVFGAPFLCIPYMGYLAGYLSSAVGKAGILLLVVAVCILSWMDGALLRHEKELEEG